MANIDLRRLQQEDVVLHFGGRPNEVDAFTFSSSLIALSAALRELNQQVNPNFSIEVTIEGVGPGSFRAKIGTKLKSLGGLVFGDAKALLINLLAAFIYVRILDPQQPPIITVNDNNVVIENGSDRVILPKVIWDAKQKLPNPADVQKHVADAFEIMQEDASVTDFGFVAKITDKNPVGLVPRADFPILTRRPDEIIIDAKKRFRDVRASLSVLKLVFERGSRKWQFVWNGVRISAPILDSEFFDKLAARTIEFSQGDVLDATLRIYQERDDVSGAFINRRYEVLKYHGFQKTLRQQKFL